MSASPTSRTAIRLALLGTCLAWHDAHLRAEGAGETTGIALVQGTKLTAPSFSVESDQPTSLSLSKRAQLGYWILSHAGSKPAAIKVSGVFGDGDVVYRLGKGKQPEEQVEASLKGGTLVLSAEPETSYAIGPETKVLQPKVSLRIDGTPLLDWGQRTQLTALVQNRLDGAIELSLTLKAPEGWTVTKPQRTLPVTPKGEAQSAFTLTSPTKRSFDGASATIQLAASFGAEALPTASVELELTDPPLTDGLIAQAEDMSGQGGGEVTISDKKVGAVGTAFLNWNDKGHWLEWPIEVKQAGTYQVVLRYCTTFPTASRELLLDGKHPAESCKSLTLPGTGGWANDTDDWRHFLVANADGTPVVVKLTEGKHTLRLNNLDGQGVNLDYLALIPSE